MAKSFPTHSPQGSERTLVPGQPVRYSLEPTQSLQLFTFSGNYIATISPTSSGIVIEGDANNRKKVNNLAIFKLGKRELGEKFFGKNCQFVSRDHIEILISRISAGKIELSLNDLESTNGTICREIDITPPS